MTELDLHGYSHDDAGKILERTINVLWNSFEELHIITGHSQRMKQIVVDILHEYKLPYKTGNYSEINTGVIRTVLE